MATPDDGHLAPRTRAAVIAALAPIEAQQHSRIAPHDVAPVAEPHGSGHAGHPDERGARHRRRDVGRGPVTAVRGGAVAPGFGHERGQLAVQGDRRPGRDLFVAVIADDDHHRVVPHPRVERDELAQRGVGGGHLLAARGVSWAVDVGDRVDLVELDEAQRRVRDRQAVCGGHDPGVGAVSGQTAGSTVGQFSPRWPVARRGGGPAHADEVLVAEHRGGVESRGRCEVEQRRDGGTDLGGVDPAVAVVHRVGHDPVPPPARRR